MLLCFTCQNAILPPVNLYDTWHFRKKMGWMILMGDGGTEPQNVHSEEKETSHQPLVRFFSLRVLSLRKWGGGP